ncbi:MAG: nitroreductase family protein [Lentisphaeria bacterium]|nr:nitroreductase family protein [Lentisphaeria bacterium]
MKKELDYIWRRRSVRAFDGQPLTEEHFCELLEAAMAAPSARHCDPWEFIVVRNSGQLQKMAELLPNGPALASCGGAIIVCGDLNKAYMNSLSYLLQDCSAALENILLAAPGLGLGGCWLGIHPREERINALREMFSIPEHIIPAGACMLGYPATEITPRTRFDKSSIHDGIWTKESN